MTAERTALAPRRVLLVGMMGTGKTTIGRALAARTGWPFLDNDALVERRTGRSARELQAQGLEALRDAEADALLDGLAQPPPVIVGCAAGVVARQDLREAMRAHATVVWLRGSPAVLARRALPDLERDEGDHRPWLSADLEEAIAWLTARDEERAPWFEEVAHVIVDVDTPDGRDRGVGAITDEIVEALAAPEGQRAETG